MTDRIQGDDLVTLLQLFDSDDTDELWWRTYNDEPGVLRFYVKCNDFFYWGTADVEEVTPSDLSDLAQAKVDAHGLGDKGLDEIWWPQLWVARKRKLRPQQPVYKKLFSSDEIKALFDAAGPERDPKTEG